MLRRDPCYRIVGVREVWALAMVRVKSLCVKVIVAMARLTRLMLVCGMVLGLNVAAPAISQAGVIPWMYDAIFGPVGSIQANRIAYRSNYGYGGYGMYGSSYAPMSLAYAPTAAAASGGCSTCSQSAGYAPYTSTSAYYVPGADYTPMSAYYGPSTAYSGSVYNSCSSCNSGMSTSGLYPSSSGCSNCTVNSTPTTTGYGPTPVPAPTPDSGSVMQRLDRLEHTTKEIEKFLKRQHKDEFAPTPDPYGANNSTYGRKPLVEEPVHSRKRLDSFNSGANEGDYPAPRKKNAAPLGDPLETDERETQKIELSPPKDVSEPPAETAPQTMRLDSRVTTRAVVPRERVRISASTTRVTANSKSEKKPSRTRLDSSLATDVVRN